MYRLEKEKQIPIIISNKTQITIEEQEQNKREAKLI